MICSGSPRDNAGNFYEQGSGQRCRETRGRQSAAEDKRLAASASKPRALSRHALASHKPQIQRKLLELQMGTGQDVVRQTRDEGRKHLEAILR
jgi:hypothetical protein